MQLTCPCCAARFPIEAALQDDAARACIAAALKLPPPLGDLILRYLGLFRPAKRALAWDRARKLLGELSNSMAEAQVTRNGITRAAPADLWKMGIEQTLQARDQGKLETPLKGHGYLDQIVWSASGHLAAAADKKREDQLGCARPSRAKGAQHVGSLLEGLRAAAHGKR